MPVLRYKIYSRGLKKRTVVRRTVIQLLPAMQAGGVERSTIEIAAALTLRGHRAVVVSAGGRLVDDLIACGAEHVTLDIGRKALFSLRHVRTLLCVMRTLTSSDIIHARSRLPAWLGWLAYCCLPDAKRPHWITTAHGLYSPNRYSAIMTTGEKVICVSNTVRSALIKQYPRLDPQRTRVIHRGVSTEQFPYRAHPNPDAQRWVRQWIPKLPDHALLLLLPGRGTRLKGHQDAIDLLSILHAHGVIAHVWCLGAQQQGREVYVEALIRYAQDRHVEHALTISPMTKDIALAYAASDCVLQLSRRPEAFGRTVLEALAVGRPVVGWGHGGVGELLEKFYPQGSVPPFDIDALATTLRTLCKDRSRLCIPLRTIPYTLHAMQSHTLSLYDALS